MPPGHTAPPALADRRYRVEILGDAIRRTESGERLDDMFDRACEPPILVVLSLRTGMQCRAGLLKEAGFGFEGAGDGDLQRAISRIRGRADLGEDRLPIPQRSVHNTYKLDLPWWQIDATSFIRSVPDLQTLTLDDIDALLALWRGDPREYYPQIPKIVWDELSEALNTFVAFVGALPGKDQERLRNLAGFASTVATGLRPKPVGGRKKLLLVEDNPRVAAMITEVLSEHSVDHAAGLATALDKLGRASQEYDAVLVDLHLDDEKLDHAGLTILERLRLAHPDLPRLLITSSMVRGPIERFKAEYGLFDVVFKGANERTVPHLLSTVEAMLSDRRTRLLVAFRSRAALRERVLGKRLVLARRESRLSPSDERAKAVEVALVDLENFTDALEELEPRLTDAPRHELARLIADFDRNYQLHEQH